MKKILFLMLLVFNYANAQDLYGTTKTGYVGFGISNSTWDDPDIDDWGTLDLEDKSTRGRLLLGFF